MSYYRNQLEAWLKTIDVKTNRVLDLGGAANPVRSRVKSFEAEEYICFDLGVEEPKMGYIKFDINEPLEQLQGYQDKDFGFDVVFCLEVFEYVWNPVEAAKNLFRLLRKDSVAYVSFPSIYPVHNPVNYDYLRYTRNAIERYFNQAGFDIEHIEARRATEGMDALFEFYRREGMHPVRESDLPSHIGYLAKFRKPF